MVCFFFYIYLYCESHRKSPYNLRFGPGKVLEKSLVLIHQHLWESCPMEMIILVMDVKNIRMENANGGRYKRAKCIYHL